MVRVAIRTGWRALPSASRFTIRSMKVTRRLTSLAGPAVVTSGSQLPVRNFWTAASATLKARIVREWTLLPTYFSAASVGSATSNKNPSKSARMTSSLIVAMTNSLVVVMTNEEGRLSYRLAIDKETELGPALALKLAPQIGEDLVRALLDAPQITLAAARSRRKLLVG